jgi:hypothetical protein
MEIATKSGRCFKIDESDFNLVSANGWHVRKDGYVQWRINSKTVYLHRLLLGAPDGMDVDHINGDRSDNRRSNLRLLTRSENIRHLNHAPRAKSGFWGVTKVPSGRWAAANRRNGVPKCLGTHDSPELAAKARDAFLDEINDTVTPRNFNNK